MVLVPPPLRTRRLEPKRHVLLVDNDALVLRASARQLRHRYLVTTTTSTSHALEQVRTLSIDFAVVDYQLDPGEPDGIVLLAQLKAIRPRLLCAIYSGFAVVSMTVAAMRAGADHVASKDERLPDVLALLEGRAVPPTRLPTLAAMERELVRRTLAECEGNKARTARSLGISRQALHEKLSRWRRG